MALVERDRNKDVRRLRPAIRNKRFTRRPFKVGIVEVDVRATVTCRRELYQPSSRPDQRGLPVYEDKVAKMFGAELCFKAVNRVAKWRRHHSSICDNNIERRVTL
jgi:hypothetical protein